MFVPPPLHPDRPGLVAPVRLDPAGREGPTPKQARGAHWRRTFQGFHVPTSVDGTATAQRVVEAAAVLGGCDAVTGWAALRWLGGPWFTGLRADGATPLDVALACRGHLRPQPGLRISQEFLRPGEVILVDGIPVTTAVRSVCFEMRYAPSPRLAVVALDMACYSDLVTLDEVGAYVAALGPWTGIAKARHAVDRADENAWSPQEVLMRLTWTDTAGCPRPLCNAAVFDRTGRHLGTPDLIDPRAGVLGQYDGAAHLTGSARARDVRQEAAYREVGLECVTMTAADNVDPEPFVRRLQAAYERARRLPVAERGWTVAPPDRWVLTDAVERRRALSPTQRARLLRYRRAV